MSGNPWIRRIESRLKSIRALVFQSGIVNEIVHRRQYNLDLSKQSVGQAADFLFIVHVGTEVDPGQQDCIRWHPARVPSDCWKKKRKVPSVRSTGTNGATTEIGSLILLTQPWKYYQLNGTHWLYKLGCRC